MNQVNNKTRSFTRFISNDFIDLDFPRKETLSAERGFSTKFSCMDEALNEGIKQGMYVLFSTEQKPSLALVTQLAETVVQEYGAIFVSPMNYLSILPAFIYSRQSLLYDFQNAKQVEQLLPFSQEIRDSFSKNVQEKVGELTKNMAFLGSNGIDPTAYLKPQMESLLQRHDKFICFVDASAQNYKDFLLSLHSYRQLTEELAIPVFIYRKVPLLKAQNDFDFISIMDEACQCADYAMFMKRYCTQKNVLSNINQQTPDWLLYQIHVMPSYLSPGFSTSFLSFYHQFGLFEEA